MKLPKSGPDVVALRSELEKESGVPAAHLPPTQMVGLEPGHYSKHCYPERGGVGHTQELVVVPIEM